IAALGNNTLEIVDLNQKRAADRIASLQRPQGVAYLAESDTIAIANGGDGTVRFYDAATLHLRCQAKGLDDADNLRYDPAKQVVYVGYGSGAIAMLNPQDGTRLGEFKLDGHPESFQLETHGQRIFVNVPDADSLEVIDRST